MAENHTINISVGAKVIAVLYYWILFLILEYIFLNKCGYVINHFNALFLANDLLLADYCIFISDYGNDVRQNANLSDFFSCVQNGW